MLELLLGLNVIAQAVGPGYVGLPGYQSPPWPHYVCLNDTRSSSYVNLRSRPTTRAQSRGRINHGASTQIVNRVVGNDDGMWWAEIVLPNGQSGYVRDDYVCVR
jgi:hypothetical protein